MSFHLKKKILIGSVFLAMWAPCVFAAEPAALYLGVLEPWFEHYVDEVHPQPYEVRVCFAYRQGVWQAMPSEANDENALKTLPAAYPEALDWTVAFDGKKRGAFTSRRPASWSYYSDIGVFETDSKTSLKLVSTSPTDFDYWGGSSPFHPMVLVSAPNTQDPDVWKVSAPERAEVIPLFPLFRKQTGAIDFKCDGKGTAEYPADWIHLVKAYRSRVGASLIALQIDPQHFSEDCDGPSGDNAGDQWFLLEPGQAPRFIQHSMELIDAGDYDHDGSSEIIFHVSGYDYDGYLLLYNHRQKQVEFGWGYH